MSKYTLANKLFALPSFQSQFNLVLEDSACQQFSTLKRIRDKSEYKDKIDINNLLSCASILHQSNQYDHLDAALRISQYVLNSIETTDYQKISGTIILEALTNKPAIKLAINRNLLKPDYKDSIPFPFQLEILGRDICNCIIDLKGNTQFLNSFQKNVYESAKINDFISISAPTSAGKSYVLSRLILDILSESNNIKTIVYIVPTRALLSQVEEDLREMINLYNLKSVYLSSIPQLPEDTQLTSTRLFVFTQERLHWYRCENPKSDIDLLIVDEAQKISDGSRGILLQHKIEDLINDFPSIKIFFSAPYVSNPELLLQDLPNSKSKVPIKTEFIAVNQNLIFVNQKPRHPKIWEVKLETKKESISLGEIELKFRPTSEFKRLAFIAENLADKDGGNIIYSNGAAFAEKLSNILYDALPDSYSEISDELNELIKLIKKTVHSKYSLAKVLQKKNSVSLWQYALNC